jgi:hypothetical protein
MEIAANSYYVPRFLEADHRCKLFFGDLDIHRWKARKGLDGFAAR